MSKLLTKLQKMGGFYFEKMATYLVYFSTFHQIYPKLQKFLKKPAGLTCVEKTKALIFINQEHK
jgi:hypothetical protein